MKYCLIPLLLCCLFTGCVNLKPDKTPLDRFALGPAALAETSSDASGAMLYIDRPNVPVYMEADRMYLRGEHGEINSLHSVRWAEPLSEGLARSLAEYIELKSEHTVSAFYPWMTQEEGLCTVNLNVFKLIADENGTLLADIGWRLHCPTGRVQQGRYQATLEWDTEDFSTYVTAMNEAIGHLASDLIKAL